MKEAGQIGWDSSLNRRCDEVTKMRTIVRVLVCARVDDVQCVCSGLYMLAACATYAVTGRARDCGNVKDVDLVGLCPDGTI